MLYESGIVDPLVTMKIVGPTDCRATAIIQAHIKEKTLKKRSGKE